MIHRKIHVVAWKYRNGNTWTFHAQDYPTKEIAMDKKAQLLEDRAHVHPRDILYRCIVFKFEQSDHFREVRNMVEPPNAKDQGADK
jgi:hypothetical protein